MGQAAPARDLPLALKGTDRGKRIITAADDLAHHIGVRPGQAVVKAQALYSDLLLMDAEPDEDREALERLAIWALRLSPVVAADPPDGLVIDTTGADHLHGGEDKMVDAIVARLAETGITAIAALADTHGAAHALARFGGKARLIVPAGQTADAILPLPAAALRLPPPLIDTLKSLGFDRISDLASKPRAPLTLRFGPELGRRLDQALGRLVEPIKSAREVQYIEMRQIFAEPIGAPETIERYTRKLTVDLCDALEVAGLGARILDLLFYRVDNRIESVRVGTAKPVRDVKQLSRLLCDKIETVDPGFGIEVMTLTATAAEPLLVKQVGAAFAGAPKPEVGGLVDILTNRLGQRAIDRPMPAASDLPERSVAWAEPNSEIKQGFPKEWKRPTRLLTRPEPIEVLALLPDHPPRAFTWRGLRHRVASGDGPERIFGEWWKSDPELESVRDYYYVVDDTGKRYWVFRDGDGEFDDTGKQGWYMHGIFA
ncbi:MAG: Y-family DNA polymerase [Asticcacaulis sp.]|uniref:Y-family DNA polymerase n=1 Tax=Asticcacaulis sp. TaxID=1872648 RepID=UPI003F7BEE5C